MSEPDVTYEVPPGIRQGGELDTLRHRAQTAKQIAGSTLGQIERLQDRLDEGELSREAFEAQMRKLARSLRNAADELDPRE